MGPCMIELEGLTKKYGDNLAVDSLDLSVPAGQLFAFLGPNGAGKTTTIKLITGLLLPTSGRVRLCGADMHQDGARAKSLVSYIPDQPYLYDKLTGREFLFFVGRMYGLSVQQCRDRVDRCIDRFSMARYVDELAESYSHGMKQKVVISAALLHEPRVLVIDEPMVGLDPASARLVKQVLREVAERDGCVFMSTHTLSVAEEVADRIGIIHRGQLVADGSADELRQDSVGDGWLEEVFLELTAEQAVGLAEEVS